MISMNQVPTSYLSFYIGNQLYGIDVDSIIEVLHLVALTELPETAPDVLGLMTLREVVMPVVDLRRRFDLPVAPLHMDTPIIAVNTPDGLLGLVVDNVDEVEQVEAISDQHKDESPYITGTTQINGKLLLLLDTAQIRREAPVQMDENEEESNEQDNNPENIQPETEVTDDFNNHTNTGDF